MTYETALEKIHSLLTFGSRPGLSRMRELLRRLDNPQDKLRYIHVAGTNGKGSVCEMLSYILTAAGYKTGLFISPYITDFRERIQINNQMIDKKTLADAVEKTYPVLEQLRAEDIIITEFEYVNALQFYIHAEAKCDIVVLETGMGGLLDCTNVIKPPLGSVITTIGLDHTAVLGGTIEEIAAQKCGIIKNGSAAFTSRQTPDAMKVIEETAARMNVPLIKSEDINLSVEECSLEGSRFLANDLNCTIKLAGRHQIENALTALAVIFYFRNKKLLSLSDEDILDGLQNAANPARLELLCKEPTVILDGAHNPDAIEALTKTYSAFAAANKIKRTLVIFGCMKDKNSVRMVQLLTGGLKGCSYAATAVDNERAEDPSRICELISECGRGCKSFGTVSEAYGYAKDSGFECVLACGSIYLAGEMRELFNSDHN